MIALREPIGGWVESESENVLVFIIGENEVLAVKEDGTMSWYPVSDVVLDIRYNPFEEEWVIIRGGGDAEETTDDGGPEVP